MNHKKILELIEESYCALSKRYEEHGKMAESGNIQNQTFDKVDYINDFNQIKEGIFVTIDFLSQSQHKNNFPKESFVKILNLLISFIEFKDQIIKSNAGSENYQIVKYGMYISYVNQSAQKFISKLLLSTEALSNINTDDIGSSRKLHNISPRIQDQDVEIEYITNEDGSRDYVLFSKKTNQEILRFSELDKLICEIFDSSF